MAKTLQVLFNARETPLANRLAGPAAAAINRILDNVEELPNVDFFLSEE